MSMKIKLIANPVAGGDAGQKIDRAVNWLGNQGHDVELFLTTARGDASEAARKARQEGVDRVIAAGGDGTLNEVINGLAPSSIPLAFVPLGTTNVFALEANIPFDTEAACRIAVEGEPRPVCLGMAGETRFILMAGVGYDAETVYRVDTRLKRRTGKFAYLVSALKVLWSGPFSPIELETEDGRVLRGYNLIVSNGRFYGGRFSITPQASLLAEQLDACLFLQPGRWSFLCSMLKIACNRTLSHPEVEMLRVKELKVRNGGVPVQIDGDFHGWLPMTFKASPGELVMVLPEGTG